MFVTATAALLASLALTQGPASTRSDVSLVLTCGETDTELTLAIRNGGETDTAVLLGIVLSNGRWYLPRELVIDLKRSGREEVEELVYQGPVQIAGRIDHWIVALPVRATFTLTLRAAEFIAIAATRTAAPPEQLSVRLTGRPITSDLNVDMTGLKAWRLWTGSAASNTLRLSDCAR